MDVREAISRELDAIEMQEDVRIVYACESGSRAWGMASADSDYDVRFIYARRPEWYLSLEPGRDVIEIPISDMLDISGWDLRKALRLFGQSNPSMMDWLQSPIVYREIPDIVNQLRALIPTVFSPQRGYHHYLRVAGRSYKLMTTGGETSLKPFFYCLRSLLAVRWIDDRESVPPIELMTLAEAMLPSEHLPALTALLLRKQMGQENDSQVIDRALLTFVEEELRRFQAMDRHFHRTWAPMDQLNILFRQFLTDIWKA